MVTKIKGSLRPRKYALASLLRKVKSKNIHGEAWLENVVDKVPSALHCRAMKSEL